MDAAPGHDLHGRGAPRLLRQFAALERLTSAVGPSGRARLEHELGCDLAELLVGALVPAQRGRREPAVPLCASA
ncbi:MAG: hypothetical protein ACREJR_10600 [Candidatus Rokuibacteriota bacterium]